MADETARKEHPDFGIDQEQDLLYSPEAYELLDKSKIGRWFVLEDTAVVWTDDDDGAGISWLRHTEENQRIWQHFQVAKSAGLPAGVAYQAARDSVIDVTEEYGKLDKAASELDKLADQLGNPE